MIYDREFHDSCLNGTLQHPRTKVDVANLSCIDMPAATHGDGNIIVALGIVNGLNFLRALLYRRQLFTIRTKKYKYFACKS